MSRNPQRWLLLSSLALARQATQRLLFGSAMLVAPLLPAAENSKVNADGASKRQTGTNTLPVVRFTVRPTYPPEMRKQGIEGQVTVDFTVTETGDVVNPVAIKSTHKEFEAAAVEAVKKWKFKPATKDGRPVASHMQIPVPFRLSK